MKSKRIACIAMAGLMAASLAGCGGSDSDNKDTTEATKAATEAAGSDSADDTTADAEGIKSYADIQLGTDFTDLSAEIKFYNNRTDMDSDDYGGKNWKQYLEDFNKEYPNIKVDVITDTNYAEDALTHLQSGNYETVMCIPAVDMADLSTYFISPEIKTMAISLYKFVGPMGSQYNLICAGVIISIIPALIVFICCQKQIYSGITQGAVKG